MQLYKGEALGSILMLAHFKKEFPMFSILQGKRCIPGNCWRCFVAQKRFRLICVFRTGKNWPWQMYTNEPSFSQNKKYPGYLGGGLGGFAVKIYCMIKGSNVNHRNCRAFCGFLRWQLYSPGRPTRTSKKGADQDDKKKQTKDSIEYGGRESFTILCLEAV